MLVTLVIIMLTCLPVWLAVVSTELSLVVEIVILVLIDFIGLLAKILLVSCLKKTRQLENFAQCVPVWVKDWREVYLLLSCG